MNTPYKAPSIMSAFDHELIIHVIKIHRQVHVHIGEAIAIPSESEVIQKKAIAIPDKKTTSSKNAMPALPNVCIGVPTYMLAGTFRKY